MEFSGILLNAKPVQTGLHISIYGSYFEYIKHKIFKSCHSLKSTPRDKTKMNIFRAREIELTYPDIWRIFISGSSSAGKTYFAKQLLSTGLMKVERIYYFHPDIQEDFPVDWCEYFKDIPIVCDSGLPTVEELNEMPPYSVVVLDDQFTECAESKQMSHLFRVLSSKKKLHLMIMTQRYYDMGSKGLNIRNCSNYHVLMSNTDIRTNHRVGFQMGLDKEIKLAEKLNKQKLYPYIVIDRTNQARVNGIQVYTDILSKHKEIILKGNVFTVVPAVDFKRKHELSSDGFARKKLKMDHLDILEDSMSDDSDSSFAPSQYSDSSEDYISEDEISPAWKQYFNELKVSDDEKKSEDESDSESEKSRNDSQNDSETDSKTDSENESTDESDDESNFQSDEYDSDDEHDSDDENDSDATDSDQTESDSDQSESGTDQSESETDQSESETDESELKIHESDDSKFSSDGEKSLKYFTTYYSTDDE